MKGREGLRGFLTAVMLLIVSAAGCQTWGERASAPDSTPAVSPLPPESVHLFFGNPSNAVADDNSPENFLIVGAGSAISYNNTLGTANWVSWRTTKANLGPSLRRPDFRPDPRLPAWFKRVTSFDYSASGYDRGHLVPSADRFGHPSLNEETFLMTNIVPQAPALNQYPWEKLESHARGQVRRGFDVYQIAGGYGNKGMLNGKVVVPSNCWKIIAILPGDSDPSQISSRVRIIAVDMPNEDNLASHPWERYRTSIRAIEERTGLDFFRHLPRELQEELESRTEMSTGPMRK
jgi:endonuclease G, mitochondrial